MVLLQQDKIDKLSLIHVVTEKPLKFRPGVTGPHEGLPHQKRRHACFAQARHVPRREDAALGNHDPRIGNERQQIERGLEPRLESCAGRDC